MKNTLSLFAVLLAVHPLAQGGAIEDAFGRLYNFDFAGAHRILDPYIHDHPADPLGPLRSEKLNDRRGGSSFSLASAPFRKSFRYI